MTEALLNTEAETTALAGILSNPTDFWSINDVGLLSDDFISLGHRAVMRAVLDVAGDRKVPEVPSVIEHLRGGDTHADELAVKLSLTGVTVPQAVEAARIVKGLATSRRLQSVGARIIEIAREHRSDSASAISESDSLLRGVRATLPAEDRSPDPSDILDRLASYETVPGIQIRFSPRLNGLLGGMMPGHLWVLGGFSSTGKSAALTNLVKDALRARKWVGVFSLEMTQEQYLIRLLSLLSGVPQGDIKSRSYIGLDVVENVRAAEAYLRRAPLRVYDTVYRLNDIRSKAIQMKETMGLDLMAVDFIQNVHVEGDEVKDARTTILTLQNLAKELDCTVLALSQVSNEMAKWEGDKNYYSFKGHGAIRDAADVAIMLKRDRVASPGVMDFNVVKNRHGEFSNIPMNFDMRTGRLVEADELVNEGDD